MTKPDNISGPPPMFTAEQVRAWRATHSRREELLAELRTLPNRRTLAKRAGVGESTMRRILVCETYKWVRG